jgi:glyoxylase-like metal-dependent hydrolase (beta-lactamase superfamily II)
MLVVRAVAVTPLASNCFLVADPVSREAVLIDPGDFTPEVAALVEPEGFRIGRVICTHGHIDHVMGAMRAKRALGVPLWLHAGDLGQLDRIPQLSEMFGFGAPELPAVDHHPADGETFTLGTHEARVIHTPGHSPGGICLHFPAAKILFTGDTLFVGSVGRTDLPGGDWRSLAGSIKGKLFPLGDDVRFFPGHGPPGRLGDERISNPFVGERARG